MEPAVSNIVTKDRVVFHRMYLYINHHCFHAQNIPCRSCHCGLLMGGFPLKRLPVAGSADVVNELHNGAE